MAGIRRLAKVQFGMETTGGTAVAADTIWRGPAFFPTDEGEVVQAEEQVGYLTQPIRTYKPYHLAQFSMPSQPATFEQLPVILSCAIMKDEDGTADGEGSGYVYTYTAPTTSVPTMSYATFEFGDNQRQDEVEFCFVRSFTLEGEGQGPVMVSADWAGRQISDTSFTGALSLVAQEEVLFQKGTIAIDAGGGTMGSTSKSNTLTGFSLNYETGLTPKFTADGNLYFSYVATDGPNGVLTVTFEHDSTGEAEITAYRNQTTRLIQLTFEGKALGTDDTYTYYTLNIDAVGRYRSMPEVTEQDGNNIVSLEMPIGYSGTDSASLEIVVVNETASI